MRHWVWVFGEIDGLRWVLKHGRMAFPEHAGSRVRDLENGDRAILYVTRGAFHNPTRDEARLAGITTVTSAPRRESEPLMIAEREFTWTVRHDVERVLPERTGPPVRPLVTDLDLVSKPASWGAYFRQSPIEIGAEDFEVMQEAITSFQDLSP